jgi:hypothetical protein
MRYLVAITALAVALASIGCGDEPDSGGVLQEVVEAADRTVEAGPSQVTAVVKTGRLSYRLEGRFDPDPGGFRACLRIIGARGTDLAPGLVIWMEDAGGAFRHLLRSGYPVLLAAPEAETDCRYGSWIDDHPPSLELYRYLPDHPLTPAGGLTGAEHFLYLAFLALTRMDAGAEAASAESGATAIDFDFARADRKPATKTEVSAEVRPLLHQLGETRLRVAIADGLLRGLAYSAPNPIEAGPDSGGRVAVRLELSAIGEAGRVPGYRELTCRPDGVCTIAIE